MELRETREGEVTVIAVSGRLDNASAGALEDRLSQELAGPGRRLLLELSQLEYISSAGFRVLLVAARLARGTNGQMAFACVIGHVRELFEVGGFLKLFRVFGTRDEALGALDSNRT